MASKIETAGRGIALLLWVAFSAWLWAHGHPFWAVAAIATECTSLWRRRVGAKQRKWALLTEVVVLLAIFATWNWNL